MKKWETDEFMDPDHSYNCRKVGVMRNCMFVYKVGLSFEVIPSPIKGMFM